MIQIITSRSNERIKEAVKLKNVSYRNEYGLFLIEGFHLLEMALAKNLVVTVFALNEIPNLPSDVEQIVASPDTLKKISSQVTPQGVVAICHFLKPKAKLGNRVLFLDDVADPGNVGTLIRTALAFDFTSVVLSDKCASVYNDKVISASQGALFSINIVKGDGEVLTSLQKDGYQIIATSLKAVTPIDKLQVAKKFVVILGNEAHGISAATMSLATDQVIIPMQHIDSLNVAIAGGIMMYYATRSK